MVAQACSPIVTKRRERSPGRFWTHSLRLDPGETPDSAVRTQAERSGGSWAMAKIFTHVPHPHIAHRSAKGPPKVEDQFSTEGPLARFNTFLALKITAGVGTMWCAYAFAALAAVSLPSAIQLPRRGHDRLVDQSDLPATGPPEHHHRRPERARVSAAPLCTFWPTMMMLRRTSCRNV